MRCQVIQVLRAELRLRFPRTDERSALAGPDAGLGSVERGLAADPRCRRCISMPNAVP